MARRRWWLPRVGRTRATSDTKAVGSGELTAKRADVSVTGRGEPFEGGDDARLGVRVELLEILKNPALVPRGLASCEAEFTFEILMSDCGTALSEGGAEVSGGQFVDVDGGAELIFRRNSSSVTSGVICSATDRSAWIFTGGNARAISIKRSKSPILVSC